MITPTNFQSKHFMVLPSSDFRSTNPLNFMVNLSGIAFLDNFKGSINDVWHKEIVHLEGGKIAMDSVLNRVIHLLPELPPQVNNDFFAWKFVPLQWTIYASFNSIFNKKTSFNAGYEINNWKIATNSLRIGSPSTTPPIAHETARSKATKPSATKKVISGIPPTQVQPSVYSMKDVFDGIKVDLSVRDTDGQINQIAYEVNMHGYFGVRKFNV